MRKKILYPGFIIILFIIGFIIARMGSEDVQSIKKSRLLLGTVVEIQARDSDKDNCSEAIESAFIEIKRIENLFSTFLEDSPVWKINNSSDSIVIVDSEIYSIMLLADSIYNLSGGAFDISINTLDKTWGFDSDTPRLPSKNEIASALNSSGWEKIKLMGDNTFSRKHGVGLNFGAIAKGYAVDRAINILKEMNIKNALVNAGGDIGTIGDEWSVGLQHPRMRGDLIERIKLNDFSIATSGDYEKYFEVGGQRYHHIINPATGYPAQYVMSVTVVSGNCVFADALATAIFVMGVKSGLELIERLPGSEVMIIDKNGDKHYSTGFSNFILE